MQCISRLYRRAQSQATLIIALWTFCWGNLGAAVNFGVALTLGHRPGPVQGTAQLAALHLRLGENTQKAGVVIVLSSSNCSGPKEIHR